MVDTPTTERLKLGAPRGGMVDVTSRAPYGWAPLAVLLLVGLVDRIEFGLLSGVLPMVQAEWGFSDTVAGSIPTASALAAALVSLPAGYIADRHNRTRIIAVVVVCWALATLGSGLATGLAFFYAMRVFLSAAESIDNPAAGSLLADYYPRPAGPRPMAGPVSPPIWVASARFLAASSRRRSAGAPPSCSWSCPACSPPSSSGGSTSPSGANSTG